MLCIGYSDFSRMKLSFPISPYSDNDWDEFDILKHTCLDCVFLFITKAENIEVANSVQYLIRKISVSRSETKDWHLTL